MYVMAIFLFVVNICFFLYEYGWEECNMIFFCGFVDVWLGLGYWFFDFVCSFKGNFVFGLGVKLFMGDYNVMDIFYNVGLEGIFQVCFVD